MSTAAMAGMTGGGGGGGGGGSSRAGAMGRTSSAAAAAAAAHRSAAPPLDAETADRAPAAGSSASANNSNQQQQRTLNLADCLRGKALNCWNMFTTRKKEEDLDDAMFGGPARHRPEELGSLVRSTKFSRKEIQLIYRGFKQECPNGVVDEQAFKEIFVQFFPQGDATQYAHYVFKTFKNGHTGTIKFEDFLQSLSQASRGTVQEKMRWIFCLYDLNGDGYITKAEMTSVAMAIFDMLGRHAAPAVDDQTASKHVEQIFHKIDANQDGLITFEELSQWCSREERFVKSLGMLDTVL